MRLLFLIAFMYGRYIVMAITPSEFENTALFRRLGLPSTLIRPENGASRKRSSNGRNLKTPAFRFLVDRKQFENKVT